MCRLLGILANKPVTAQFSLLDAENSLMHMVDSRKYQSFDNDSGWGIASVDEKGKLKVNKSPLNAKEELQEIQKIGKRLRSPLFICHIRKGEDPSYENTHPFQVNNWAFAHNGKINKFFLKNLIKDDSAVKGTTDSELFFHLILQEYNKTNDIVKAITTIVRKIRKNCPSYSALNFILSDSKNLYAYKEKSLTDTGHHELNWLFRDPQNRTRQLRSSNLEILFKEKVHHEEKAIIIASEQMTEETSWKAFDNYQLMILDEKLEPCFKQL